MPLAHHRAGYPTQIIQTYPIYYHHHPPALLCAVYLKVFGIWQGPHLKMAAGDQAVMDKLLMASGKLLMGGNGG
jgi:hypothetical protein